MAHASDTRVASNGDTISFRPMAHRSELADSERFGILSNAPLHKEHRAFRVDFNEDGDNQQGQKQHNKPHECHDSIEAPLEKEPDSMLILLHVA